MCVIFNIIILIFFKKKSKVWHIGKFVYAPPRVQCDEWRVTAPRDMLSRVPFARKRFSIEVLVRHQIVPSVFV